MEPKIVQLPLERGVLRVAVVFAQDAFERGRLRDDAALLGVEPDQLGRVAEHLVQRFGEGRRLAGGAGGAPCCGDGGAANGSCCGDGSAAKGSCCGDGGRAKEARAPPDYFGALEVKR